MQKSPPPRILLATAWRSYDHALGLVQYANQAGWHLDLTTYISGELPENWKGEGIITLLGEHEGLTRFIRTNSPNIPTTCMTVNRHDLNIPCVDVDNEQVGKMAAMHFIEQGFRNYAFYSHTDWPVSQLRGGTFCKYIKEAGCSCQMMIWDNQRGHRKNTWNNREQWIIKEFSKRPRPLAVFAVDDMRAVELIEACMQLNLHVPDDVAILGVGNSKIFSASTIVPLSSISIDSRQLGYEAAHLLDRMMQGEKPPKQPILFKPLGIQVRRSTDTIATEHPGLARAIRFMLDNYHNIIGIDDIVAASNMSQTLLYELFKDSFHQSPVRFLAMIRLKKAKHLIRESDLKITTIASQCGFGNSVNLFRNFQRIEGVSPTQFRQSQMK